MATKRSRRKAEREIKNFAKKRPFVFFLIVVLIAVAVGVYYFWQKNKKDEPIITDDLQIHFLQLGNGSSGDCTLIKTGNTEVLIDAGSTKSSAETIVPYIHQYCTDGELDYVIATHGDADHIAAFVGTNTYKGVFDSFFCKTIIDFPKTTKSTDLYNEMSTWIYGMRKLRRAQNILRRYSVGIMKATARKEVIRFPMVLR